MRVFFMGCTRFSLTCFAAAKAAGCEIVGCAGTPELFDISYSKDPVRNVNYFDLGQICGSCVSFERGRLAEFVSRVAALKPDLILVAGWYYMVGPALRSIAPMGAVGLHGSLLPRYRGGAPLVWAMIEGEIETGVTLFQLDGGVDTGDIIGQEPFRIEPADTIADALLYLESAAERLLFRCLPLMAEGKAPRIPQDHAAATVYPQRSPKDGEIDWSWDVRRIQNFIRAQTRPYPGAWTRIGDKRVTIWHADLVQQCAVPGDAFLPGRAQP